MAYLVTAEDPGYRVHFIEDQIFDDKSDAMAWCKSLCCKYLTRLEVGEYFLERTGKSYAVRKYSEGQVVVKYTAFEIECRLKE